MNQKNELNERQTEVLNFIVNYTEEHLYSPSIREICNGIHLQSTSTVHGCLKKLVC